MGKLRSVHLIEALAWLAIAAIFFIYSFEFNQKIEIYKFGATAWPRSILLMLILVIIGNLFYQRANGSEAQPGRVGITEDDIDDADKSLSSFFNIGSFLVLPLIFAPPPCAHVLPQLHDAAAPAPRPNASAFPALPSLTLF